jgi:drug/metabolite transporter (DMT)-like permease
MTGGRRTVRMRYGYWWIEALLGGVLIAAPFVGKFTALHPASYTDVVVGVLLVAWALVGYWLLGETNPRLHGSRA